MYGTIDLDNHMYLKSKNDKYIDISQKSTTTTSKSIKYGRLYNWYAATDGRGIAPGGWHVPTIYELDELESVLGGFENAGGELKESGTIHWESPNIGNHTSQFNLLPGGEYNRTLNPFEFKGLNTNAYLLSVTETVLGDSTIFSKSVVYNSSDINTGNQYSSENKYSGLSIRLIKDNSIDEGQITIDGDIYDTVKIGNQVWLKQNLAVKHYQNGDLIGSDFSGTEGAVTTYYNDENNVYDISTITQLYPVINGEILYDTILDNPIDADRFNDVNTLDVLDLEFPCEESLIQPIIDLCLKEIGVINNIPRDVNNNASDDSSLPRQQTQSQQQN